MDKKELLEAIANATYEGTRAELIASLDDDTLKEEFLETIMEENNRSTIIASLTEDKDKKTWLQKIKSWDSRAIIIASLTNDQDKKELIETVSDDDWKCEVAKTFIEDEDKIAFLKSVSAEPSSVTKVILSLKSASAKIDLLISVTTPECRTEIIQSILANATEEEKGKLLEAIAYDWEDNRKNKWNETIYASAVNYYYEQEKNLVMESLREDELKAKETEQTEEKVDTLEGLSIEELSAIEVDLDKQIAENEKIISQEQERKALIERITGKRAKIAEQQVQLSELRQERDNQPSKDSQQH